MAAWLYQPVMFESGRDFDCEGFDSDQCQYYKKSWHNWYVADLMFALPTVVFFMCCIGIFVIGYLLTQIHALSRRPGPAAWRRAVAATRYLSYRGFHVEAFGWNSAPIGVLLLGALGTVYLFCMDLIPAPYYWPGSDMIWGNSPPLGTRSGWLALACMPFVFATASKTNWITLVTGVTHEKLQVFHRWIAYAFFLLALMHTFPFIVWHIRNHDMVDQVTVSNIFEYWTGIVALVFQAWLTFASWGPFRSMGYEFFKVAHFFAVIVFVLIFFWHCSGTLTSWDYFVSTAAVYVPCLAYPWLRTLFEYGLGQKASLAAEENGFTRISVPAANLNWYSGQHCFLRFRCFGISVLGSHPFTICSLPSISPDRPSELIFYVRRHGGLTARLHNYAVARAGAQIPILVDGPYGGIDNQKFFGSDRLVVIAGGSGAGWMLPFIEQYVRHVSRFRRDGLQDEKQSSVYHERWYGPQSLRVVLATRDVATRTWFESTLHNLLSSSVYESLSAVPGLTIEVHVTGDDAPKRLSKSSSPLPGSISSSDLERSIPSSLPDYEIEKQSATKTRKASMNSIQPAKDEVLLSLQDRPDLPALIRHEAATNTTKSIGVFVCGPLTMQNDVRNAVARHNLDILQGLREKGEMYLHLEHFSWT